MFNLYVFPANVDFITNFCRFVFCHLFSSITAVAANIYASPWRYSNQNSSEPEAVVMTITPCYLMVIVRARF
jgi:hypothetical protein